MSNLLKDILVLIGILPIPFWGPGLKVGNRGGFLRCLSEEEIVQNRKDTEELFELIK